MAVPPLEPKAVRRHEELGELLDDLETFAFQRERVLAKLDLRAAAQARHIARRIRTVTPFVQHALDDDLAASASIELGELVAQACVCLGRSAPATPPRAGKTRVSTQDAPAVRDPRRDPTLDADPMYRGPTVGDLVDARATTTKPAKREAPADSAPAASGVRVAGAAVEVEVEVELGDAAACRQWKSLLGR